VRYVGYNHSNSDALPTDECLPQAQASIEGSNHGVSETGEQTQLLSPKEVERRSATAYNGVLPFVAP